MTTILTLPSDSSMEYFPDNKISHYRVHLPKEYLFDSDYEVGLTQFHYPRTWFNVYDSISKLYLRIESQDGREVRTARASIPEGYYSSIEQLVKMLNYTLSKVADMETEHVHDYFHYLYWNKRVTFNGHQIQTDTKIKFGAVEDLWLILGFLPQQLKKDNDLYYLDAESTYVGLTMCDLDGPFKNIYVYADIVKSTRCVGHTLKPLLKVVPIQGNFGDMILYEPKTIDWLPLRFKRFRHIEVYIRDDRGLPVKFETGKSLVTIHVRKRLRTY